jgi:hypothetical protein
MKKYKLCKDKKIILVEVPYWITKDNLRILQCITNTSTKHFELTNYKSEGLFPNIIQTIKY